MITKVEFNKAIDVLKQFFKDRELYTSMFIPDKPFITVRGVYSPIDTISMLEEMVVDLKEHTCYECEGKQFCIIDTKTYGEVLHCCSCGVIFPIKGNVLEMVKEK